MIQKKSKVRFHFNDVAAKDSNVLNILFWLESPVNRQIKGFFCTGNAIFGGTWYQEKFNSGTDTETLIQHGLKALNGA